MSQPPKSPAPANGPAPMGWDPELYLRFQRERFAPFDDLFALIRPRPGMRVIDLGCGSGELTRRLAEGLPGSNVLGVDNSPAMLERARTLAMPGLRFELTSIEEAVAGPPGEWDVVFSNAALHWVNDHAALIPRLRRMLAPGGQLAVQIPANHNQPAHLLIPLLMSGEPFATALGGWSRSFPVLTGEGYAKHLFAEFGANIAVMERIYPHLMPGAEAIAEWTASTTLLPYFDRLDSAQRELFLARYREELVRMFPDRPTLHTFRRILFHARDGGGAEPGRGSA